MGQNPQDREQFPWMTETTKQPVILKDSAPNPKLVSGALGGPSTAGIIVWLFSSGGVDVPLHVALEMSALLAYLIGYLTPARKN
jgi:hypothetical protein